MWPKPSATAINCKGGDDVNGVTEETMYAAALQSLPGLGSRRLKTLLDRYRSAKAAWQASWDDDLRCRWRFSPASFGKVVEERNVFDWDGFQRKLSFYGVRPIALWDDDYPCWLPFIAQPPLVLFCQGMLEADRYTLAMVGSRKASPYGLNAAETLAMSLAERGITLVSGGARGIDTRVHTGALKGKGRTVVVVANGLNRTYPRENKRLFRDIVEQGGAILSEYTFGTEPRAQHFPARNRIIAGVAAATVVIEAALGSGSLITADFALEEGRDVFAMPGSIFAETSKGTNHLLQMGAMALTGADDILQVFQSRGWHIPAAAEDCPSVDFDDKETCVLQALSMERAIPAEDLLSVTGLSLPELLHTLLRLQLKKAVEEMPGGFVRCAAAAFRL